MKIATGKCKINGVGFGDIRVQLFGELNMMARFALMNSETGERYGGGDAPHTYWSKETLSVLAQLIASMEKDVVSLVFEEESENTATNKLSDINTF